MRKIAVDMLIDKIRFEYMIVTIKVNLMIHYA